MHSRSLYALLTFFGAAVSVPLLFGILLLVVAAAYESTGAFWFSILLILIFMLSAVYVHALIWTTARLARKKKILLTDIFEEARKMYWRMLGFDLLIFLLLGIGVWLQTFGNPWLVALGVLWVIGTVVKTLGAPVYLAKNSVFVAVLRTMQERRKNLKQTGKLLLGVLLWFLVPFLLWFIVAGTQMSPLLNAQLLLTGHAILIPTYFASTSEWQIRIGLLILNVLAVVASSIWIAQETKK